jgi:death-on-curing protein
VASADDCIHLTVDIVKEIHKAVIDEFGGLHGVRDEALLSSAVAAPQATVGGRSPYADVIEVAAAYLFYLCRNHAFNDGNKRVAMASAIAYLRANAVEPAGDSAEWEELVLDVAASRVDRGSTTARLRRLVGSRRTVQEPSSARYSTKSRSRRAKKRRRRRGADPELSPRQALEYRGGAKSRR